MKQSASPESLRCVIAAIDHLKAANTAEAAPSRSHQRALALLWAVHDELLSMSMSVRGSSDGRDGADVAM